MEINPKEFLSQLIGLDLPVEAKLELIAAIIRIASHFADDAWQRTPEQPIDKQPNSVRGSGALNPPR